MKKTKRKSIINTLPAMAKMLGDKMKVRVRISGDQAYTNGDLINIPCLPEGPEAITMARGYLNHEAAHVRFTDFGVARDNPLHACLSNVLEDVRIEKAMGAKYPGCKKNLQDLVALLVSEGAFSVPEEGEIGAAEAFVSWLIAALRCSAVGQTALQPVADANLEVIEEIFSSDELDELMDLAIEGSLAESTQEVSEVARKMVKLLELWEKQKQQQQQQQKQQQKADQGSQNDCQDCSGSQQNQDSGDQSESSGDSGKDDDSQNQKGSGSDETSEGDSGDQEDNSGSKDEDKEDSGDNGSDDGEDDSNEDSKDDSGDGKENGKDDSADNTDRKAKGAGGSGADEIKKILEATESDLDQSDLGSKIAEALSALAEDVDYRDYPITLPEEIRATEGSVDVSSVRKQTAALRGKLSGLIEASRRSSTFAGKSGRRLDQSSLNRIATKDPRIFRNEIEQPAVNTAFVIVVDRSSSMCGIPMDVAAKSTLAAALALDAIPGVSVATAAYPGPGLSSVLTMSRFGESVRRTAKRYGIDADGSTPTDEALYWAGVSLSGRKEPRKICLVITDGDPNDSSATIAARERLEASGIEVVGLGIKMPRIKETIPESEVINNLEDLPKALFGVLQKKLC